MYLCVTYKKYKNSLTVYHIICIYTRSKISKNVLHTILHLLHFISLNKTQYDMIYLKHNNIKSYLGLSPNCSLNCSRVWSNSSWVTRYPRSWQSYKIFTEFIIKLFRHFHTCSEFYFKLQTLVLAFSITFLNVRCGMWNLY